jgi:hypothetical protein
MAHCARPARTKCHPLPRFEPTTTLTKAALYVPLPQKIDRNAARSGIPSYLYPLRVFE